jgi:polyisoprenoid-binding protein YceI
MSSAYTLQPEQSRFTVQAFASGLLSFMGHSPTFVVRDFAGQLHFPPQSPAEAILEIVVQADSLELMDAVSPQDREEIEARMRREVLETSPFPTIAFSGTARSAGKLAEDRYRALIEGQLALHSVIRTERIQGELALLADQMRLTGEFSLRMSDYQIRPVTAVGGAIKLKDALRLSFDLVGRAALVAPVAVPSHHEEGRHS